MSRLAGKVALISGAARGMGVAEARLFAREGARVVLADILAGEGKAVEDEITAKGGQAVFTALGVTRETDWTRAVALAESRFGALHVLVNNAGIGAPASRVEGVEWSDLGNADRLLGFMRRTGWQPRWLEGVRLPAAG